MRVGRFVVTSSDYQIIKTTKVYFFYISNAEIHLASNYRLATFYTFLSYLHVLYCQFLRAIVRAAGFSQSPDPHIRD